MLILLIVMIATLVKGDLADSNDPPSEETTWKGIVDELLASLRPEVTLRYCYFEKLPVFLFAEKDIFVDKDMFYFDIDVEVAETAPRSYIVAESNLIIAVGSIKDMYALIHEPSDMSRYYKIDCACLFDSSTRKEECIATGDARFNEKLADVLNPRAKSPPVESKTRNGTMAYNIYADMEYLVDLLGVPYEYQAFSAAALAWVLACASLAFVLFLLIGICKHSTYQPADTPKKK
jgi:hypothetical protein